jgi:hypothetical protein
MSVGQPIPQLFVCMLKKKNATNSSLNVALLGQQNSPIKLHKRARRLRSGSPPRRSLAAQRVSQPTRQRIKNVLGTAYNIKEQ